MLPVLGAEGTAPVLVGLLDLWQGEALLRMLLCVLIGGVIGLEREFHGRAAGFRTHILLCLGCGIIMLTSTHFARVYQGWGDESVVRLDPARLAYGVITGIGFLGAGVIMKHGGTVHGLTTAASLWIVAALGLSVGLGMYLISAAGTLIALLALWVMRTIGTSIHSHYYRTVRVTHREVSAMPGLRARLEEAGATVLDASVDHHCAEGTVVTTFSLRFRGERTVSEVYDLIRQTGEFDRIQVE